MGSGVNSKALLNASWKSWTSPLEIRPTERDWSPFSLTNTRETKNFNGPRYDSQQPNSSPPRPPTTPTPRHQHHQQQTNKQTNEQTKMEHKNKRRSHLVRSKRQRYWRSNWSSKSQWIGLREDESNKSISWKQIKHYWRMLKVFQIYTIDNGQKKT